MSTKILIADDEKKMLVLLKDFLEREDFQIITANDGREAYDKFIEDDSIGLVILDIMMPYMTGLEVCEKIRETSGVPIIMLTAKTREIDELFGFNRGADEYIRKPFSPSVLVARVKALLKRTIKLNIVYSDGVLHFDFDNHITKVNDEDIYLETKDIYEYDKEEVMKLVKAELKEDEAKEVIALLPDEVEYL